MHHHTMNVLDATINTVRKCCLTIGTSVASPASTVTVLLGAVAMFYASTDAVRSGHQKHTPFMLPSTSKRDPLFNKFTDGSRFSGGWRLSLSRVNRVARSSVIPSAVSACHDLAKVNDDGHRSITSESWNFVIAPPLGAP